MPLGRRPAAGDYWDVFVETAVHVPLPVSAARRALDDAIADGGLVAESRRAYATGRVYLMRVGPAGGRGMAKRVLVRVLPSRTSGESATVPLRWEATGPAGGLFPIFDANLSLAASGPASCTLAVTGSYTPPLGPLGARLDRAVLSRVALRTMEALLREIAERVAAGAGTLADVPMDHGPAHG